MSLEQLESAIQSLSPNERRRFILWIDDRRGELLAGTAPAIEESWKQESRRRLLAVSVPKPVWRRVFRQVRNLRCVVQPL